MDLFIAASAAWDLPADDPRLWPPAHALGRQIIVRANQDRDNRPHNCPSSFPEYDFYHQRFGVVYTLQNQRYVQPDPQDEDPPVLNRNRAVMALGVTAATGIQGSLIVSRGDVQCTGIQTSVILANGDVTAPGGIFSSVIVSDGDVTVDRRSTGRVIIVARGNIRTSDGAAQSFFAACGQVTIGEKIRGTGTRVNTIEQNVKAPLGVRFFELSDVGLTVRAADGTVTVDAVADGSSCARAGVRAGDTFLTVNGRRPVSAESLRRLLRDALGPGDAAVRLGRGAETVVATVALPD